MNKPTIGIRQADGSFYSIMDEEVAGKKRLILSAATSQQASVKIDLFRSEDGTLAQATRIGTLALEKPTDETLQEIELILDLDEVGRLNASAGLPGHPSRQEFDVDLNDYRNEDGSRIDAPSVTDQSILDDKSLDDFELDSLDESAFVLDEPDLVPSDEIPSQPLETEALPASESVDEFSLDGLPELGDLNEPNEEEPKPEGKSDREILDDDAFADIELDSLSLETEEPEADLSLTASADPEDTLPDSLGDLPSEIDGGLDESLDDFSTNEPTGLDDFSFEEESASETKGAAVEELDEFNDFSMDDEPKVELSETSHDEFSLDDIELDSPASQGDEQLDSLDEGFKLDDEPPWTPSASDDDVMEAEPVQEPTSKAQKKSKAPKPAKTSNKRAAKPKSEGAGDKMALLISLLTLGLLVMTILVLLFLNMIKVSQPPQIKPEVMRWKTVPMAQTSIEDDFEAVHLDFNNTDRLPDLANDGTWNAPPQRLVSATVEYRPLTGESRQEVAFLWGLDSQSIRDQGSNFVW